MRCPICRKPVDPAAELAPFCSERCKLIDLGNWASERYVISTPSLEEVPDDVDEPDNDDDAHNQPGSRRR